jgi:MoaA/NifB/PqqE/SkfB family radical SAM enzyme
MKLKERLAIYRDVVFRPFSATAMLWGHRRTVGYLLKRRKFKNLYNYIFVTYFVRGEDCGKGALDPVWKFFPWLTPYLWDIEFEITTNCYLRCIMCEHTYFDKSYLNQNITFENFKKVLDPVKNLKWINVTGEGSSFLNPDFLKILRYLKSRNIYVDFTHDFFYMTDEIARELINLGIERIYVSIDAATKETYEKIRVGSNFDKVTGNIKRFVELKKEMKSPIPELCFRMNFFKDNVHEVEKLLDLIHSFGTAKDLGDEPSLNVVSILEFEQTKGWVVEIPKEVVERVDRKAKKYGIAVYWSHPTHVEEKKPPLDYCIAWTEPYVMIRGHVVPCCGVLMSNKRPFLEKFAFGNVYEKSLKEIWDSKRYRQFRRMIVNPNAKVPILCAGCRSFNTMNRTKKYGVSKDV